MEDTDNRPTRPLAISVICVAGALFAIVAIVQIITRWPWMAQESLSGSLAAVGALALSLVCLYGLWRMRRWAVVLLAVGLGARILYGLLGGPPLSAGRLAGPSAVLVVALLYFRRLQ